MYELKIVSGAVPYGTQLRSGGDSVYIEGVMQTLSGATDLVLSLKINPEYGASITKTVTVKFTGTTGKFTVIQDGASAIIPPGGINTNLATPVPVGEVSGGQGPFAWTVESGMPTGM